MSERKTTRQSQDHGSETFRNKSLKQPPQFRMRTQGFEMRPNAEYRVEERNKGQGYLRKNAIRSKRLQDL